MSNDPDFALSGLGEYRIQRDASCFSGDKQVIWWQWAKKKNNDANERGIAIVS